MNIVDLNSDTKNVFARFGEAVYEAQCLEKQLVILLSFVSSPIPNKMSKLRYDELIETNLEQTFGSLANEVKSKITISTDIQTKLDRALEGRNWLSHNFWWDRASEFTDFQGRQGMLLELNELIELFSDLDLYFTDIVKKWAFQFGLTQHDFDESLVTFLSGPTPPRKNRRKLNKTEKLHNIYFYDTGNGTALLFELDDHSFWSLCDCGLTYGPENLDLVRLRPVMTLQKALPATIRPKPKGAKDWYYSIQLSLGYYIEVEPYEKNGQFAVRCKIKMH